MLTSLYFLSRNKLFPVAGGVAALIGIALGVVGFGSGEVAARLASLFIE